MGLKLTTAPSTTVLSTTDVKLQLALNSTETVHDTLLTNYIHAAEDYAETFTGRQFLTATYTKTLDYFPPGEIRLDRPPLQSVTSITYVDTDGTTATLGSSGYQVSTNGLVGSVCPSYNNTWPGTRAQKDAVTITFVAGSTSSTDVPKEAHQAMRFLVAHWFENRTEVVTGTVAARIPMAANALLNAASVGSYR